MSFVRKKNYCCCNIESTDGGDNGGGGETDIVPETDISECDCSDFDFCIQKLLTCGCSYLTFLVSDCLGKESVCNELNDVNAIPACEFLCDLNSSNYGYTPNCSIGEGHSENSGNYFNGQTCGKTCEELSPGTKLGAELNCYDECGDIVPNSQGYKIIIQDGCTQLVPFYLVYAFSETGCCPKSGQSPGLLLGLDELTTDDFNTDDYEPKMLFSNSEGNPSCTCTTCSQLIESILNGTSPSDCPTLTCKELYELVPKSCFPTCPQDKFFTGNFICTTPCSNGNGCYTFFEDISCGCPNDEWLIPGGTCHKCAEDEIKQSDGCCEIEVIGFNLFAANGACPQYSGPYKNSNEDCCPQALDLPQDCPCWGAEFEYDQSSETWVLSTNGECTTKCDCLVNNICNLYPQEGSWCEYSIGNCNLTGCENYCISDIPNNPDLPPDISCNCPKDYYVNPSIQSQIDSISPCCE